MNNELTWWWIASDKILEALSDRQGIGDELKLIDDDILAEIRIEIADIIMNEYVKHIRERKG